MPYKKFAAWDVPGGIVWISSVLWAGYLLGQSKYAASLDRIIIIVIFVSFLPIIISAALRWMKSRAAKAAST
jgi:membrane-associated protein